VRAGAVALGLLAALTLPASTGAGHDLNLTANARDTGYVELRLHARPGVELLVRDDVTGEQRSVVPEGADTTLARFTTWRCDRRERRFSATQAGADGATLTATAELRTPSCARRFALSAPRRVRTGRSVRVRVRDRWKLGDLRARVCTQGPGAAQRCRMRAPGSFRLATRRAGGHRVTLRTPWQRVRRNVRASNPGGRLTVLATGDSMIQIIDSYLEQRIDSGRTRVRSDARISTGLSKPSLLDWQAHARRQAASRPDAVVMFIGANDGFPMAGAACCGPAWVAEYARRARRMIRTYARGGRARVYWLLLPAPRGGFFREIFPAVNAALRRAARGLGDDVRLIDLARVFTPGGRYRDSMEIGGKVVRVRQGDGVHLNTTGASLAASLVIRALRSDRILR
jgi:lysophospholipase L1-like esterase